MTCRGIRGAVDAADNSREAILHATRQLLAAMAEANGFAPGDLASVIFTTSPDLNAEYPAAAARQLGWTETPMICGQEIPVPGGLERCIRVLIHWNTERPANEIRHVYLGGAERLRPDWAGGHAGSARAGVRSDRRSQEG